MSKVNTYLFVTRDAVGTEYAAPVRGVSLHAAMLDAADMFYSMSYVEQAEIVAAYVVNAAEYNAAPSDQYWIDYADFMKRPHKWLGHAEHERTVCLSSTGGGVWIAYWYENEHVYYVLDNTDEMFNRYDDTDEDYMCENYLPFSESETDETYFSYLTDREKYIFSKLHIALYEQGVMCAD